MNLPPIQQMTQQLKFSNLKERAIGGIRELLMRKGIWAAAVMSAGFLAIYWDSTEPTSSSRVHQAEDYEVAATAIPAGFVLVPIEVANYESLDSILGKYGVVDLYIPPAEPRGHSIKVAERVKILRAPLNPSHFAVLAPENESSQLVRHDGPFLVVVQNPSAPHGTKFVNHELESSRANQHESDKPNSRIKRSRITVEVTGAE